MVFNNSVQEIFGTKTAVKLLSAMYPFSGQLSGRALARLAGVNHQACNGELKKLIALGVVKTSGSGRTGLYELNRKNILVSEMLKPIFEFNNNIYKKLGKDIQNIKVKGVESIILFGSIARKQEMAGSDIDIMFVVKDVKCMKDAEDKVSRNNLYFYETYGNSLSPIVITIRQFKERYAAKSALLMNVVSQGQILYGKEITELINDKKTR